MPTPDYAYRDRDRGRTDRAPGESTLPDGLVDVQERNQTVENLPIGREDALETARKLVSFPSEAKARLREKRSHLD